MREKGCYFYRLTESMVWSVEVRKIICTETRKCVKTHIKSHHLSLQLSQIHFKSSLYLLLIKTSIYRTCIGSAYWPLRETFQINTEYMFSKHRTLISDFRAQAWSWNNNRCPLDRWEYLDFIFFILLKSATRVVEMVACPCWA